MDRFPRSYNCSPDRCHPVCRSLTDKAAKTLNMFKLILMAIALVVAAVTGAPMPEPEPAPTPAPGPLPPPLIAPYPVVYTAPYVKVYPYHPIPLAYYNSYKWIPGSAYTF
ncbi:uncharacterized protein LOC105832932 [Monomorium pharaonis]|uniref:uncharacterized protein LOC105832932 n=1 Tax=Monomorium pharaonis TaxID=307658 RepID=UPI001747B161|nr:uncharacterized protein LOC105832932 [Monomorium pharaonis]